jgi:hypothetical protein
MRCVYAQRARLTDRGYHPAVCIHVDTQSGCFGGNEADFALQTRVNAARRKRVTKWNWSWSGCAGEPMKAK